MPGSAAIGMPQAAEDFQRAVVIYIKKRRQRFDALLIDHLKPGARVLAHFGAQVETSQRCFRVGQSQLSALREHDVQIQLFRHLAKEDDAFLVKDDTFGSNLVRADRGGVARSVAASQGFFRTATSAMA